MSEKKVGYKAGEHADKKSRFSTETYAGYDDQGDDRFEFGQHKCNRASGHRNGSQYGNDDDFSGLGTAMFKNHHERQHGAEDYQETDKIVFPVSQNRHPQSNKSRYNQHNYCCRNDCTRREPDSRLSGLVPIAAATRQSS